MKVSFVVPVYKKSPEQLREALQSLSTQSHKDIEVVVVFDGPDADLEAVAAKYSEKDSRFTAHVIEHGGAPKARNFGFLKTTGDVVSFWDADCYAEPEMTRMWVKAFEKRPHVDFVYSGYQWTDPKAPGFESEPFDPWTIHQYNYIASMFPIRRERFPGWDESLEGLQDWDYWRRVAAGGSVGAFIPGYGFSTDLPDANSISGNAAKTRERVEKIRRKFGDAARDILVFGNIYKAHAVHLAKLMDADYFWNWPFYKVHEYKTILVVGLSPYDLNSIKDLFIRTGDNERKVIYWMGGDAEGLAMGPFTLVSSIMEKLKSNTITNICDSEQSRKTLEGLGITAEILPYPREEGQVFTSLPEKFKVLALADDNYKAHLDAIINALPNIEFTIVRDKTGYNINDYSAGIQFTAFDSLIEASKKMLIHGRYMISTVQEPYSGYVDPSNISTFKAEVVNRIMELSETKEINREAADYYLETTDPETFKARITALTVPPALEVVA